MPLYHFAMPKAELASKYVVHTLLYEDDMFWHLS